MSSATVFPTNDTPAANPSQGSEAPYSIDGLNSNATSLAWGRMLRDRCCREEFNAWQECCEQHVPGQVRRDSMIDLSLFRLGMRECRGSKQMYESCMEASAASVRSAAATHPSCSAERGALQRCRETKPRGGGADAAIDCEKQAYDVLLCGLALSEKCSI